MRLSLRFIIPLLVALALIAYAVVPLVDRLTLRWFVRDLDIRSNLVASAVYDSIHDSLSSESKARTLKLFQKITRDERLFALGYCSAPGAAPLATDTFPPEIGCSGLEGYSTPSQRVVRSVKGPLHVSVVDLEESGSRIGSLVLVHDMSFVHRRSEETKNYLFLFFIGLGAIVSLITVAIAQMSWRGWMEGVRALMRGEGLWRPAEAGLSSTPAELRPIERDLRLLIRDMESEYRARDESQITWSPDALKTILHNDLLGENILVVSNREPYIHTRRGDRIEVSRPASGLVTALEPILRACSGTWIAHGSGSADRDVVDAENRVAVPPGKPDYNIRRVWLTEEEEEGYYYGFSNEGLWPLCHIAHVRPTFRSGDWKQYIQANEKFACAVAEEAKTPDPIVLVQDYHFALLPRMIRQKLPDATVITFWHIPWPNPEAFAICPWRAELLDGLLGSSILGFHTQFHCNNFLDTVDRTLEARVDRETNEVTYGGRTTAVKRYPISIEWPPGEALTRKPVAECRRDVRERNSLPPDHFVGIGVDRLDYTKGIIERFLAVERLMEKEPGWIGKFSFIQIAAPSRSKIGEYREFEVRVRKLAERINSRFARGGPPPLLLKVQHHEPPDVYEHFRAADVCFVSSLHDGMNLVAKEFLASRDDERGALILSRFTGAARELPEALIVNPYDTDKCAAALHLALTMPETEQRDRIRIMRGLVREFNVFRWGGRMLLDAAGMRQRGRLREGLS